MSLEAASEKGWGLETEQMGAFMGLSGAQLGLGRQHLSG